MVDRKSGQNQNKQSNLPPWLISESVCFWNPFVCVCVCVCVCVSENGPKKSSAKIIQKQENSSKSHDDMPS